MRLEFEKNYILRFSKTSSVIGRYTGESLKSGAGNCFIVECIYGKARLLIPNKDIICESSPLTRLWYDFNNYLYEGIRFNN